MARVERTGAHGGSNNPFLIPVEHAQGERLKEKCRSVSTQHEIIAAHHALVLL